MTELAIVGGGYWGTCLAVLASDLGVDVKLLDDHWEHGASRNSAGIFQEWWYKAETSAKRIPSNWDWKGPSVRWLMERELVTKTGETFTTNRNPVPRFREDCRLVNPLEVHALAFPVLQLAQAMRLVRDPGWGWRVVTHTGDEIAAKQLVVAAGARTDDLLEASGLPCVGVWGLRGRAVVLSGDGLPQMPHTHLAAPYTHFTLRPWGDGRWRWGDTVERSDKDQLAGKLLPSMLREFPGTMVEGVLDGQRPESKQYICDEVAPGLVVMTGGHRVGLGLSQPVAERALRLLRLVG